MKNVFVTIALLLVAIVSNAQSSNVLVKEKTIGSVTATQEEIKAKEYVFSERIYRSYVDTISNSMTVQLRELEDDGRWSNNEGKIIFYDLNEERVRWSKNIAYKKNSIQQFDNTIIFTKWDNSYRLSNENGEKLWKVKNDIYLVDPVANIGIGYKLESLKGKYDNLVEGIDLKTGKTKWKRVLNGEYGWNDAFRLNDSVWMIAAAGLHTVNIYDGSGWSYKTVTGDKYYNEMATAEAAGIILGVFTGVFMVSTGNDILRDVVSNVYSDNTGFYFASKEKISKINKDNGKTIWSYPFPAGVSSNSFLFSNDNHLFMINYGYAFMGVGQFNYGYATMGVINDGHAFRDDRQIYYGTPFFAAFNKDDGKQVFCSMFDHKKNPILDFKIEADGLLLIFKDRIIKLSLSDGSQIFEKTINNDVLRELNVVIDSHHMRIGDYKLVRKDNQTIVLDADNNKVAEMEIARDSFLRGNKLYSIGEKSVFEIDMTNLFQR